jgi:hypothetical protein
VAHWYVDAFSFLADRASETSLGSWREAQPSLQSLCTSSYSDSESDNDSGLKSVQRAEATLDRVTPHSTTRDPATPLSLELLITFRTEPEDPLEAACTRLSACTDKDKDKDTDRETRICKNRSNMLVLRQVFVCCYIIILSFTGANARSLRIANSE